MGMMIDIGAKDRRDIAAPVQLLLNALLQATPNADIKLWVLTNTEVPGETVHYAGTLDALLAEFQKTNMPGFVIMFYRCGSVSVRPPKCFASKSPYWRVLGDTVAAWDEVLLDEIIRYSGVVYGAITQEETLDLEDHVNKHNFPWQHWRLVAARFPEH
jgi:hypothetical protein